MGDAVGIIIVIVVLIAGYMYLKSHTKPGQSIFSSLTGGGSSSTQQRMDDIVGGTELGYLIGQCESQCKDTNSKSCDNCLKVAAGKVNS